MSPDEQADLLARLKRIKHLTEELIHAQADSADAQTITDRMKRELDAARRALETIETHRPKR